METTTTIARFLLLGEPQDTVIANVTRPSREEMELHSYARTATFTNTKPDAKPLFSPKNGQQAIITHYYMHGVSSK